MRNVRSYTLDDVTKMDKQIAWLFSKGIEYTAHYVRLSDADFRSAFPNKDRNSEEEKVFQVVWFDDREAPQT